ncbi:DNA polymerase I [Candidatus Uhrbacteria bacterium]|nr:DNA polymerase I [Candidatus Uhrbacteria bacterium]
MGAAKETFIIIDGNALLHRAWHALPPLQTKQGVIVNAVYGFLMILLKALNDLKPTYVAVTFDTKAPTFRDEAYDAYKAHRVKQPDELYAQIPILKNVLAAFRIPVFEKDGFEADDIIGTLASSIKHRAASGQKLEAIIVTGDMDATQLVDEHTRVLTPKKGISDSMIYDIAAVQERYGLLPSQMIDYKALRGDPSDNIPGVKGIGEKTATALLQQFGTLENIYHRITESQNQKITERVRKLLLEQKEGAMLSKKLATIVRDVPIDFDLEKCRWAGGDEAKIVEMFQELGFRSLLNRLPKPEQQELHITHNTQHVTNDLYVLVDTGKKFDEFLEQLAQQKVFAFDTETDSVNPLRAKLVGISFSWKTGEAYYVSNAECRMQNAELVKIFVNADIKKVAHNAKFDVEVLAANGIAVQGLTFDTMIASYLLNPGSRQHGLDKLAFEEFGFRMTPITDLIGVGKKQITMDQVPLEQIVPYACADADYTWRLYEKQNAELRMKNAAKLFEEVEMPLVPVLIAMETAGVKIDTEFLGALSQQVGSRLAVLEKEIHGLAGEEFNVQSPIQLKKILFEKLQISTKGIGKTKTGLSTAADELEKMKGAHPIITPIIEYRELAKLQSTYLEALPALVDKEDGRLHTSFNQTVAATGRLSSSDPNLQNIPIRTELGNEIRKAFIAEQGNVILAADYSQIELRVAAHLSGDTKMIAAFQHGEDFHSRTAAEIHDVPIEKVTKEMRRDAKTINFGILYGMGSSSLAAQTAMSRDEARAFIEKYFVVYKELATWIEATKELARTRGYVETLFGRRRYLPEINSGVPMVRAAAERMAVNMPIQGTATGDIMKMAMVKIHQRIMNNELRITQMLLQVHDELVFEVAADAVDETAVMVKEVMEHITKLSVPIKVEIEVGENWGALEARGSRH